MPDHRSVLLDGPAPHARLPAHHRPGPGGITTMAGMVTQREVAARAGVSPSVVSAVLAGSSSVRMSEETRRRIEQVIAETGYRTNHAARSLRQARSRIVSAVVPKLTNPIFNQVVAGIETAADLDDTMVIISDSERLAEGGTLLSRLVGTGMADGFLVRETTLGDETIAEFQRRGIPFVVLNGRGTRGHTSVWVDDTAGIAAATDHLLELGHRRIGLVGGPVHGTGTDDRRRGFDQAHAGRRRSVSVELVRPVGYEPEAIHAATRELLALRRRPTALVVDNAWVARAAVAAAIDHHVAIPDELSIITYHDIPTAEFDRPALSSVAMPLDEAGRQGYAVLRRMINGERPRSRVITDPAPRVIDRGSTRPPA